MGSNTDELYIGDGRSEMAESLREQHPDVVRIINRWGRDQHYINYRTFQKSNKFIPKPGVTADDKSCDFGMGLAPTSRTNYFEARPEDSAERVEHAGEEEDGNGKNPF
jgi:hypothetical protein